jgi:hypothetical protein
VSAERSEVDQGDVSEGGMGGEVLLVDLEAVRVDL